MVFGSREAVQVLQQEPSPGNERLAINYERFSADDREEMFWFHQLPSAIGRNHHLKSLFFMYATVDDGHSGWTRLLKTALPSHPSLKHILFWSCQIAPRYLEMLASSVALHPGCIRALHFCGTPLAAAESSDAVATLLRVSHIEEVHLLGCHLDATACHDIVTSLDGNTALRELRIQGGNDGTTLDSMSVAAICRSGLRDLRLWDVRLTASVVHELAHGLRGNDALESLTLATTEHRFALEPFEELLRHYNVALRTIEFDESTPESLRSLLLVNERVRAVHTHLQLRHYRVADLSLWPYILAKLSSKPNLVFRLVRNGTAELCVHHMEQNSIAIEPPGPDRPHSND